MRNTPIRRLSVTALLCALVSVFALGAILDPKLQQQMSSEEGPFEVIVTFTDRSHVHSLSSLGINYLPLTILPMAGAILTHDQINTVLSWNNVESIYFNDRLEYFNNDAGRITGAHYVQNTLRIRGTDVTILVLDSGVDASHPDLAFRSKVVENVKIVGDLGLVGASAVIEGVINTDNTSGHGTHVAGTAGGSGVASAVDERDPFYYRGVAPDAALVGVGAGETLFILSALIGFDYAIATQDRFGTDIVTNSWGNSTSAFDPNNPISKASFEAYRRGMVVTFAAGNGGPANNTMSTYVINPWVIGVAAGTKAKALADFSSRGEPSDPYEHPDITAPGVSISSTRAPGTPVGALGPVVNPSHPEYYLYYHTISGTSMATPFVAGTVALLLDANPNLSPDQIEEIIVNSSDPMSGYQRHEVGSGYINVRRAVETALTTVGNRHQFLAGDTKWSSQGAWTISENTESNLGYFGQWRTVSDPNASGGSFASGTVRVRGNKVDQKPLLRVTFFGTNIKIGYRTDSQGGTAEVFIDGQRRDVISYYSATSVWNVRSAFGGLENTNHVLELRGQTGRIYVDYLQIDGMLFPNGTQFTEETTTYNGTMGPSVLGVPETHEIAFGVSEQTIQINAELGWNGGVDIDLYLIDPNGQQVASSASLDNPEVLSYWVTTPGTYTYRLEGFATVVASYTLTSTQVKAVPSAQPKISPAERVSAPSGYTLYQNHPNPFNPQTTIEYVLPSDQYVELTVHNVLGQQVATLVSQHQSAGLHRVSFEASYLPSGVYFYRLSAGTYKTVRRMVVMK